MIPIVGWLVVGIVVALYLLGFLLVLFAFPKPENSPGASTRILLVCLRLAIAWHFLVEGVDKLKDPSWTSQAYLRESSGPLAPMFRDLAGDPIRARLTLTEDNSFPDALDTDWQHYVAEVKSVYSLDEDQTKQINDMVQQLQSHWAMVLSSRPRLVDQLSPQPPPLKVSMTMKQRLEEYEKLQSKVDTIESGLMPAYGSAAFDDYKTAKANLNKWRGSLNNDLEAINDDLKRHVRALLLEFYEQKLPEKTQEQMEATRQKLLKDATRAENGVNPEDWGQRSSVADTWSESLVWAYRDVVNKLPKDKFDPKTDPTTETVNDLIIERRRKDLPPIDPITYPVSAPVSSWGMLHWSDAVVKYGIAIVGAALFIGLFTRVACVCGAGFLLLFFLAMPPLPGWPESPRAEGHYLFINKNIIEMLALLTLGTTRSGCWLGIDALVQFLSPKRWRDSSGSGNINSAGTPASSNAPGSSSTPSTPPASTPAPASPVSHS